MTTLVADAKVPGSSALPGIELKTTARPVLTPSGPEHEVHCPACGLPATIEWRDMVAGVSGPVIHMQLRCPLGRHWFVVEEGL